jgi:hypothetical protein
MPGPLLHQGAVVLCAHGGQAQPTAPNPRVTVNGLPIVTLSAPYVVAGCPFVPPAPGPCVSAQFVSFATRLLASGQPLLLADSQAVCIPTGTPVLIASSQPRVTGI